MFFHFFDVLTIAVITVLNFLAAVHALITKKEPRAALCWIAVCFALPGFGAALYVVFGVNRISTVAQHWQSQQRFYKKHDDLGNSMLKQLPSVKLNIPDFDRMKHIGDRVCSMDLLDGCDVKPLYNGSSAYPRMIEAINQATETVFLSSYIFSPRKIGREFIDALDNAHQRGIEVCVLIDGIGALYSWPTAYRKLKNKGVPVALFLRPFKSWYHTLHLNLRNHRKLLIIDGKLGFTGGMNIHPDDISADDASPKIVDLHFEVRGPVVGQLQDTFVRSWYFATGELKDQTFYFDAAPKGNMLCRGVDGGPNRSLPRFSLLVRSALSSASRSVKIMTPYLILDECMRTFFTTAALRGIKVEVILPKKNNLSMVKWASETLYPTLLNCDIDLYYREGPFAHTKLLIMDDDYVLLGSSNIDNRSMYLNFEFDLEVYSKSLAGELSHHFNRVKEKAESLRVDQLESQTILIKLRNAFFNLFSPYM